MTIDTPASGTSWHPPSSSVENYLAAQTSDVESWSIERHLEACTRCRELVCDFATRAPLRFAVETGWQSLAIALEAETSPSARIASNTHRWRAIAGPGLRLPWIAAFTALLALVTLAGRLGPVGAPPLLLLLAPVLPLCGVAITHGPLLDPTHEISSTTPLAGLELVLLRTTGVLAVCLPAAAIVGAATGRAAPALWLLPSVALTLTALLLGSVIGVTRASAAVAFTWFAVVVTPAVTAARHPFVLTGGAWSVWLAAAVAAALLLLLRRRSFLRLESW